LTCSTTLLGGGIFQTVKSCINSIVPAIDALKCAAFVYRTRCSNTNSHITLHYHLLMVLLRVILGQRNIHWMK